MYLTGKGSPMDFAFSVIGEILWQENVKIDFQTRDSVHNFLAVWRESKKLSITIPWCVITRFYLRDYVFLFAWLRSRVPPWGAPQVEYGRVNFEKITVKS